MTNFRIIIYITDNHKNSHQYANKRKLDKSKGHNTKGGQQNGQTKGNKTKTTTMKIGHGTSTGKMISGTGITGTTIDIGSLGTITRNFNDDKKLVRKNKKEVKGSTDEDDGPLFERKLITDNDYDYETQGPSSKHQIPITQYQVPKHGTSNHKNTTLQPDGQQTHQNIHSSKQSTVQTKILTTTIKSYIKQQHKSTTIMSWTQVYREEVDNNVVGTILIATTIKPVHHHYKNSSKTIGSKNGHKTHAMPSRD